MSAGVFVLAAVLQLAATQGLSGEEEWAAVQRRVTLGNSRSMGREYMLERVFRGPVPADPTASSAVFTNILGGFSIQPAESARTNYWAAVSTTNTEGTLLINPFNLMERGGFYRERFDAKLQEGDSTPANWSFALRTRSPVAAGYSFAQQRPANNDLASLATPPYVDMTGTNEQFFGFYGLPRVPMSSVTNVMTRGSGDVNGYQGYLDVPPGASVYGIFPSNGIQAWPLPGNPPTMEIRVDLSVADPNVLNSVLRYDVPPQAAPDTNADGVIEDLDGNPGPDPPLPVYQIRLLGAEDELRRPLHIVADTNQTALNLLTLSGDNVRRVYFYRAKSSNNGVKFDVNSIDAGSWRLGITMSQCNIQFDIGNVEITGGLRTDGDITFQGGSANFVPEADPGGLDFIADRMMWLEDYRAQQ